MSAPLQYSIRPVDPAAHLYEINLLIAAPDPGGQLLTLPAWIPGSYMIRDFARNIVTIAAKSASGDVLINKLDKQSWRLAPTSQAVTVSYRVYAWDLSVRAAHLDQTHGYFNGTSVFLRVVGQEKAAHTVDVLPPPGDGFMAWRVSTTLPSIGADERGFGEYSAPDYEALVDYPVEMGTQRGFEFMAAGVAHSVQISWLHRCDYQRLSRDLALICTHHAAMFGELPVDRYLFLVLATADGYGGLEHRDSTSLICARDDLPVPGLAEPDEGYRRFLGLCSHEYFHLWNVKRIRPERLKQADLSGEVHTELLWAFEGFTSYYDDLALVRCGCISASSYLELLAHGITRVMRGTGRTKQSVAESSFDAWTKFYKQDENAPNAIVSYYAKGALVAFGLDMTLRDATTDTVSLDDLLRALWLRHGKPDIGLAEQGIETLASELAGCDLSDFFACYVHGTDELPLERWLASAGIGLALRAAKGPDDQGGSTGQTPERVEPERVLGARWSNDSGAALLSHVLDGGAAQAAGLSAGDRLIAIDGLQVKPDKLARQVAGATGAVTIHAFRGDVLMAFEVEPRLAPADTATLWPLEDAVLSEAQRARREAWLGAGGSQTESGPDDPL
jgi:predicted metalloprotease with PDZ domain